MGNSKIMIIDGSSLLHRAFYALPLLTTKKGLYTNGVYGFLTMFYKLQDEYDPDYICVAFDKKGPTFRHKEYEQYKGTRQSTPSELAQQFPLIREILSYMNITTMEMSEFEADDIAGTLARVGEEKSLDVILVTGDKDYLQLATDKTKVLITKKGITELEIYDKNRIIQDYGIEPRQFIDLKGLMGDKSDNIPGVPGVGEKTGLKLIKEYGSLEEIYENLENISGKKLKENLIENKNLAFISRKLGEIILNVPLDKNIDDLTIQDPKWKDLKSIFEELEFKSLLNRIPAEYNGKVEKVKKEFKALDIKSKDFLKLVEEIKSEGKFAFKFIIDDSNYIENDVIGIGLKTLNGITNYIDLENEKIEFVNSFKSIFEDKSIKKIGHNLKIDIIQLFRLGIDINSYTFDSMIAQYLINPSQSDYSINNISEEYLDYYGIDRDELLGKGKSAKSFSDLDRDYILNHISFLLESVEELEPIMISKIKEQNMESLYNDIELPLVEVLASMEFIGFKIDEDELKILGREYDEEIKTLTNDIYKLSDIEFNINSPKQIGEILFEKLGLPVIKKTKTGYSTNVEVLEKLIDQHPIIEKILRYRQIVKLKSTYIDGLVNLINRNTNRIHSSFNQTIATTGRISSTDPNLQNIPIRTEDGRRIRKAFVTDTNEFRLLDGDYSQIELRVLAHISEDPKLIEAFVEGEDIHRKTASEVFHLDIEEVTSELRYRAKAVNFGIVYGISDFGLAKDLNISRKEAKEYIENYFNKFKLVREYMDNIVDAGKENGYVETILNRRRYIPELSAKNFNVRSFGERIAMNTPIQGSAADIIKMAMVKVYHELKNKCLKSRLILTVHDELILEVHKDEVEVVTQLVKNIMENSISLKVPLKVDYVIGDSWYDTK
ncbi:DNA polymerase I [Tissierella sp. Yu-01]|uniref:DNA polymerase I n=1 Tax=Tissierella sp. Yu-01 TaxID=3035694 RepID=UPI00240E2732|nr:DNA polymerase I [Tissierella sp. Yu-01]WFA09474.1 DNA polymerase I [Tissierella sp. Yu-01]